MKQIAAAFIKAQSEMGSAVKDSKNPYFKSTYADLNAVREACIPLLNQNGIAVLQPTVQLDGKNFVKTILLHESGETIESLTEIVFSKANDAQAQGSGITYARRYGLQSLVCIGAEDDDGNKASEKPKDKPSPFGDKRVIAGLSKAASDDMTQAFDEQDEALDMIKIHLGGRGSITELEAAWREKENDINTKLNPTKKKQIIKFVNEEKARILGE